MPRPIYKPARDRHALVVHEQTELERAQQQLSRDWSLAIAEYRAWRMLIGRNRLKFNELCGLEPLLKVVAQKAADGYYADLNQWQELEALKKELLPLVGWESQSGYALMHTENSWECAFRHVLDLVEQRREASIIKENLNEHRA